MRRGRQEDRRLANWIQGSSSIIEGTEESPRSGGRHLWERDVGTEAHSARDPFMPSVASSDLTAAAPREEVRVALRPPSLGGMQAKPPPSASSVSNEVVQKNRP